MSKLIASVGFK